MASSFYAVFLLIFQFFHHVSSQTFTNCNPLNTTCPPDPALSTSHTFDFTNTSISSDAWNVTATDSSLSTNSDGAAFTIAHKGDAPTITSKFYLFFGRVEVWMRAAPGQGVISSIVLQSDDLDEIDWEIIGSNTTFGENNYYGKGNQSDSVTRAKWFGMSIAPQAQFHNYTTLWTAEKLEWWLDGNLIRTLKYNDALNGANYPQTPMQLKIGSWAGGDSANSKGTIEWAGGPIDYDKGPYVMMVKSATVSDFSSGKEYRFKDHTGAWQSIDIKPGNSTIAQKLNAAPSRSMAQKWQGLSSSAKIGIACGVIAVLLAILAAFITCCVRSRRAGRRAREAADAQYEKDTTELFEYRRQNGAKSWDPI